MGPWRAITYSCADTEKTRAQINEHNMTYESLKQHKIVELKDTCPPMQQPKPQPPKPVS